MKHSEFWRAVETVYGSAYGRSLAQDLVLPGLRSTCVEALDAGIPPRRFGRLCAMRRRSAMPIAGFSGRMRAGARGREALPKCYAPSRQYDGADS